MGITFNRPDFTGAASNSKQDRNMLQQIQAIKQKHPNPNKPEPIKAASMSSKSAAGTPLAANSS